MTASAVIPTSTPIADGRKLRSVSRVAKPKRRVCSLIEAIAAKLEAYRSVSWPRRLLPDCEP